MFAHKINIRRTVSNVTVNNLVVSLVFPSHSFLSLRTPFVLVRNGAQGKSTWVNDVWKIKGNVGKTVIITITYCSIYLYTSQQPIGFKDILTLDVNLANKTMNFFLQHLENLVVQTLSHSIVWFTTYYDMCTLICLIMLFVTFAQTVFSIQNFAVLFWFLLVLISRLLLLALLDMHLLCNTLQRHNTEIRTNFPR